MKLKIFIFLSLLFLTPFFLSGRLVADEADDLNQKKTDLTQKIEEWESEVKKTREKIESLRGQIAYMDSQAQLAALKISQTINQIEILEVQVEELSKKIGILNVSLDQVSALFINRVVATYKAGRYSSLDLLFSSKGFAEFFRRARYLKAAQTHDQEVLITMEEIRLDYDHQKQEKEAKQKELEALKEQLAQQKLALEQQKKDKEYLLKLTQNDERRYQELIAEALAELQAIQAIAAGKGQEKEMGVVGQGEKIASIISGRSPCSTGTHLHFEVREGDSVKNPFSYLSPTSIINDSGGDQYSFGGNWSWPVDSPVRLTQGFGSNTWWIRTGIAPYGFHTGIDIVSDNLSVKAVREGVLYNGSIACGSGYLRYVRIEHKEGNFSTYYLHINYEKI